MRLSRRANLQHHGVVRRLVNFLDPASGQGWSQFTHYLRNFYRVQCHNLLSIGHKGIFPFRLSLVTQIIFAAWGQCVTPISD